MKSYPQHRISVLLCAPFVTQVCPQNTRAFQVWNTGSYKPISLNSLGLGLFQLFEIFSWDFLTVCYNASDRVKKEENLIEGWNC